MSLITWKEQYNTGIPAIDTQHLHLVKLINELHDGMRAGQGNDLLRELLDRLVSYTITHFSSEEKLMASVNYPGLAAHKREHEDLTKQVKALVADWQAGRVGLTMHVFRFLKDWLTNHILKSDQAYVAFIKASKAGKGSLVAV